VTLPGKPLVWSPKGVSDTLDASTSFPGSMASLKNLIPDPSTSDLWQCRPASRTLTGFPGFISPSFISCLFVSGTKIYGMIATGLNPGREQPFSYDAATNTFDPISGITAANTPLVATELVAWNPPVMALIGAKIIVAHPGFDASTPSLYFGVLDISNPAAPVWTSQNTTGTPLVFPPQWVVNFNGRCFFLVNPPGQQPAAYMSDSLNPTVITNANQILTFGDNLPLTCAAGLPLNNQLGGILQSLMIFKGAVNIYQVVGDYALGNLAINTLNVATGTLAPNSVCSTPKGLAFMAPDGLRMIDFSAHVTDPIGTEGKGVSVPFIYAVTPSRINAAYNRGVYRVQTDNGKATAIPVQQQYWYDFTRGVWSGPHSVPTSLMASLGITFIVTPLQLGAQIWQSDCIQSSDSSFVEDGEALIYEYVTAMLPDTEQMAEVSMIQTTVNAALSATDVVIAKAVTQDGVVLDQLTFAGPVAGSLWGGFLWGQALWGATVSALYPRRVDWSIPIVFRRAQLDFRGTSSGNIKFGRIYMRYQVLGYMQQEHGVLTN
jgi:hypothetical protein